MCTSLIVPVAADKAEYKDEMPYLFRLDSKGNMICLSAIGGLDLSCFDKIYITILKKHSESYLLKELLSLQFKRLGIANKAFVIELDRPTKSQPETVYETIKFSGIQGNILIKVEKRILGRDFCAGGYFFESADLYCSLFEELSRYTPLYMSHLIYTALLHGINFRPIKVKNYLDWGTLKDWRENE